MDTANRVSGRCAGLSECHSSQRSPILIWFPCLERRAGLLACQSRCKGSRFLQKHTQTFHLDWVMSAPFDPLLMSSIPACMRLCAPLNADAPDRPMTNEAFTQVMGRDQRERKKKWKERGKEEGGMRRVKGEGRGTWG